MNDFQVLDSLVKQRIAKLEQDKAELLAAIDALLGKLEIMSGCNEYDMEGPEQWPEFADAHALISKEQS